MSINLSFGERLDDLMKEKDINSINLSELTGISTSTISEMLNLKRENPTAKNIIELSKALNVSSDYLLGLSESKLPDIDDRDIHEKTGLSDLAIKALKKQKFMIDNIYDDKKGHLFLELQSINMLIEDMGYMDEDNPKTSFINLFTKYRMFLSDEASDLYYMTDYKGKIEPLKTIKTSRDGTFVSSDKLPFKVSMLENMFLMAIQDRLKEMKKNN